MSKLTGMLAVLVALSALALSATPAPGDATWDGEVNDLWSVTTGGSDNFGNWDADPTAGGTLWFPNSSWTSTVDLDTSGWGITGLRPRGNGTLTIPAGGTLKTTHEIGMGNPGHPTVRVTGGALVSSVVWRFGLLELSGGSWTGGRCYAGPEIHVIGSGSSISPTRFACGEPRNQVRFTLDAAGVSPFAPTSGDPFDDIQSHGIPLVVDGIENYVGSFGDIVPLFTFGPGVTDPHIMNIFPSSMFNYDDTLATLTVDDTGAWLEIIPEPATMILLAGGLPLLLRRRRRRR